MRLIADIRDHPTLKRLMINASDDGVLLFLYEKQEDGGCSYDLWFEELEQAYESAHNDYGVERDGWQEIPDPLPHCQQDWIAPARVPGRATGKPQWGRLEVLRNGRWVELTSHTTDKPPSS